MAKKSEIIGEFIVTIHDNASVEVSRIYKSTKEALKEIWTKNGKELPEKDWNTQDWGRNVLKEFCGGAKEGVIGEYSVQREPNNRINVIRTYKNTMEGLREVAKELKFLPDPQKQGWNTQRYGAVLVKFAQTGEMPKLKEEKESATETSVEEIDVREGYDASIALAEASSSAAVVFHKFGDGYADDAEVLEDFKNSAECFFILLEKDGQFRLFRERVYDETKGPFGDYITFDITNEIEVSDAVYYSDKFNDIYMSDETEDTISSHSDYSLDNAIDDVLSGTNENEWPAIDVDFIYNGKIFYSFTL